MMTWKMIIKLRLKKRVLIQCERYHFIFVNIYIYIYVHIKTYMLRRNENGLNSDYLCVMGKHLIGGAIYYFLHIP